MRSWPRMVVVAAGVSAGSALLVGTGAPAAPITARAASSSSVPSRATSGPATAPLGAGVPAGPRGMLGAPTTTTARAKRATTAPTVSTRPPQGLRTPEAAARNLWDGWRDDDRPRARLFAGRDAVEALFVRKWDPSMRDAGCVDAPTEAMADGGRDEHGDRYVCTFRFLDGRAELIVRGTAARGHRVVAVTLFRKESPTTTAATTTTVATKARGKART